MHTNPVVIMNARQTYGSSRGEDRRCSNPECPWFEVYSYGRGGGPCGTFQFKLQLAIWILESLIMLNDLQSFDCSIYDWLTAC